MSSKPKADVNLTRSASPSKAGKTDLIGHAGRQGPSPRRVQVQERKLELELHVDRHCIVNCCLVFRQVSSRTDLHRLFELFLAIVCKQRADAFHHAASSP